MSRAQSLLVLLAAVLTAIGLAVAAVGIVRVEVCSRRHGGWFRLSDEYREAMRGVEHGMGLLLASLVLVAIAEMI